MPTTAGPAEGQYEHDLEGHRDEDTPKVESADRKEQESQSQDCATPDSFQVKVDVNAAGNDIDITVNIGSNLNLKGSPPARPPPQNPERKERAMNVIGQAAIWAIRTHGILQNAAPVILEILGNLMGL